METRRIWVALAVLWTFGIMIACWIPASLLTSQVDPDSGVFDIPYLDKIIHFGIFLVFTVLWLLASTDPRRLLRVAVGGVGLAVLTEAVQHIPAVGREFDLVDAVCDVVGILVGVLLLRVVALSIRGALAATLDKAAT